MAEDGADVVGMIGLTVEGDGLGQVRWFLVAPRARGGLGRSLMTALLGSDPARTQL